MARRTTGGNQMTKAVQEHHAYSRAAAIEPLGRAIATQHWLPTPPFPLAAQRPGPFDLAAHAAAQALSAGGSVNVNVQVMYMNDLHVHKHADPMVLSTPAAIDAVLPPPSDHFHPNDPIFRPCYSPQGLDFGFKVVSRSYKAEKHTDPKYNMIIYSQCSSAAQTFSHALTLHLSYKRTKHAIFLFDCGVAPDDLASSWSQIIHLSDINSMIQKLGPFHEYYRKKVKNKRFSLYFFIIKRMGAPFSRRTQQIWSNLFRWADAHQGSSENSTADAGSHVWEVVSQVAGVGVGIISAIA